MQHHSATWALFAPVLVVSAAPTPASAQEEVSRSIEPVAQDLYRWTSGSYRSMFLVHEDGIVVTDPLNAEAARWLKGQLEERYPGKPVSHLIYSHDHPDHTYGASELADEDTLVVSQRLARNTLVETKAQTLVPTVVFDERMTLLPDWDQEIRLRYHGSNNGRGSISMMFRPQNVLHIVDWVVIGRLPYRNLKGYDLPGMIESTRQVLELDFDRFVGGHAEMGHKDDVRRYLGYLEALHDGVRDGILAGHSLDRIKRDVALSDYSDLAHFEEWRELNIEGAYNQLVDGAYMLMRPDVPKPPDSE
ncbi:hypothetical protein GCM10011371_32210 [Novosphingobium marinum]|uniref:Glyoxylase-like metal-dependent hydrolase (Beta-lactamase superfamily II) n=1 Tax=Novosphingobium marinum TaxID=1514948 RepID=A0A7Z0BV45_9SPHN|nr:MBL fold metallo-hydrolase [Novosphingobium marinum]NYH96919.1 glyoxylase-like metal-dependent hydrolase (beta-lactamase superfamily II) [Novosphingobium marinum]GGC42368.1 hypothetical protein GCM10011371_32210 [Novosphingobium marinum]